jgi:hypothetical protein
MGPGEGGFLDHEIAEKHERQFDFVPLVGEVFADGLSLGLGEEAPDLGLDLVKLVIAALARGAVQAADVLEERLGEFE